MRKIKSLILQGFHGIILIYITIIFFIWETKVSGKCINIRRFPECFSD